MLTVALNCFAVLVGSAWAQLCDMRYNKINDVSISVQPDLVTVSIDFELEQQSAHTVEQNFVYRIFALPAIFVYYQLFCTLPTFMYCQL